MRKDIIIGVTVALVIVLSLTWMTLQLGQHTVEVCVTYQGLTNCATASGSDREEALHTAQTTACGPISGGVTGTINCGNTPPSRVTWKN